MRRLQDVMNKKDKRKKKRESNLLYDFVKITGIVPAWFWVRPKVVSVTGQRPKKVKGGVLIAANHVTFIDPIIVHLAFWYRRLWSLATKDLFSSKFRTYFFTRCHCIIVDKQNFTVGALRGVCDRLKEGKAVSIFPEGSVNQENEDVRAYKSGAILMAHLAKKPILPVYIHKPERKFGRYHVVVGDPIDISSMCGAIPSVEDIKAASEYLQQKEVELKEYHDQRFLSKKEK